MSAASESEKVCRHFHSPVISFVRRVSFLRNNLAKKKKYTISLNLVDQVSFFTFGSFGQQVMEARSS